MASVAKTKEIAQALHPGQVGMKDAVSAAMKYFRELFPNVSNLMLEEIEQSEDGKYWFVTLGYDSNRRKGPLDFGQARTYKTFSIDSASGKLKSVKIRSVA